MTSDLLLRLTDALARPDTAAAVAGFAAVDAGSHLDDEEFATLLDGMLAPRVIAHILRCDTCAAGADRLLAVDAVVPFGARAGLPEALRAPSLPASVFARVRATPSGGLELLHATGPTRVQAALAVRTDRARESLSVRDRSMDAAFELALVPEASAERMTLLVRWLRDAASGLVARAVVAGRTVAEVDFDGGSALLANLRTSSLRVEVRRRNDVFAVAWLHVDPPGP